MTCASGGALVLLICACASSRADGPSLPDRVLVILADSRVAFSDGKDAPGLARTMDDVLRVTLGYDRGVRPVLVHLPSLSRQEIAAIDAALARFPSEDSLDDSLAFLVAKTGEATGLLLASASTLHRKTGRSSTTLRAAAVDLASGAVLWRETAALERRNRPPRADELAKMLGSLLDRYPRR